MSPNLGKIKLYSYRRCPFAIRVRTVLAEKKIAYDKIEENLANLSQELMDLHPEGRVPLAVYEADGQKHVIYQSTIITEWLDELVPVPRLMPTDPTQRAAVRLWTYWCDQIFKPDLDLFKYEKKNLSQEKWDELLQRLSDQLTHWNTGLQNTGFLVGSSLTLADIHLFPFARQFYKITPSFPELEKFTELKKWLDRMVELPSFKEAMAIPATNP